MNMIRLMIADVQAHLREQLAILLDGEADIRVVGTVDNGKKAVDLCNKLRPDVVLMDAQLPYIDGFAATDLIRQEFSSIRVVILGQGVPGEDTRAIQAGASAFLLKPQTLEQLIQVIRHVHENRYITR
jgi:DNA-binding NarL/FixJ family response regulator